MKVAAFATAVALMASAALAAAPYDDDCSYTEPRNASTSAAGVTKIVIRAEAGSLQVDGVAGLPNVVVRGTACTSDESFLSRMRLTLRRVGSELHIIADIPEKTVIFGFFSARLDFAVTLPAGIPVEIEDGSGWIKVSNTGPTSIEDGSGSIEAKNIRGPLMVSDGSGSIDIDTVAGDIQVEDGSGQITIRNAAGEVRIEDGSGSVGVTGVRGRVHITTDGSGSINIRNVRGDVLIDEDGSGSIDVADVGGRFVVGRKGSGSINHSRISGGVELPRRD